MNKSLAWIAWRLLMSRTTLFGGSAPLALVGLVLGVAALVASMAVMSGFEMTLKNAMADVSGHAQIIKRSRINDDWRELEDRVRKIEPTLVSSARFVFVEAVMAHGGKISGVLIQGVDSDRLDQVLNFKNRVIAGSGTLKGAGPNAALIGKGLAKKMGLQEGDRFRVVVPVADAIDPSSFQRKVGQFQVHGILDLGKYEWNERFILTDIVTAQEVAGIGDRYTGLLMKFEDINHARTAALNLSMTLGSPYWVRDWRDSNENLFEAVEVERPGIFFVVLVITLVAAFNISATLFVNVVRRYKDIAILKTIGVSEKDIVKIFVFQGLFLGIIGLGLGFLLGYILSLLFSLAQSKLGLIAGEVYRLDSIDINIRWVDSIAIVIATLLICFIATLAPARRGGKLNPVEGLRNE